MVSDWGGMTFLIPYILFVILIASTGVIEEMALGRAAKGGPIKAFGVCTEMRTGNKKTGDCFRFSAPSHLQSDTQLLSDGFSSIPSLH